MNSKSSWLGIFFMLIHSVLAQKSPNSDNSDIISKVNCPPPLIPRESNGLIDESQNCFNDCCLACPFANNFYEKDKLENTYRVFAILGIISFFLMILLSIFFVVLPSQKQNHLAKLILLPLALSVMIFEGAEFFTINQKQSQCFDSITPANSRNNVRCASQAFFTLAGSWAISCYSALLMTHLHLISVWRIEFITKRITFFHVLIFGGSLAAFIVPYLTKNIQSTNICFISLDAAPAYFYFLFFIYIAFVAHLSTFVYMARITIKSNRFTVTSSKRTTIIEAQKKLNHANAIFKMQWRALLGALLMLIIYVLNWHFYVFGLRLLTSSDLTDEWIIEWTKCLKYGSQTSCAHLNKDHIPSYNLIFTLLFFNRTAGILIFIIFAAKKAVLLEVYDLIRGRRPRDINTNISFAGTEFSGVHSVRNSSVRASNIHNSYRFSYYTTPNNNYNYKHDSDNISSGSESITMAPSERTNKNDFRKSEII